MLISFLTDINDLLKKNDFTREKIDLSNGENNWAASFTECKGPRSQLAFNWMDVGNNLKKSDNYLEGIW